MNRRAVVLLTATMAATLLLIGGGALAETINCQALNEYVCEGTDAPDVLYGTPYQDEMNGKGGSDELYGREAVNGFNRLQGEDWAGDPSKDGDDKVIGGPDTDVLEWSFGGDDVLKGYRGIDTISATEQDVLENGEVGRPTQNPGVDHVYGGGAYDYIYTVDGYKDYIDCGPNSKDEVYFDDGLDEVVNCEVLHPE